MNKHTVLVTGGLGYIGSHTVVQLLNEGYDVVIIDNLSNSKDVVIYKIFELTYDRFHTYIFDLQDQKKLESVFNNHSISFVIHFAGLKAVKESIQQPVRYYKNNISSTLTLLDVMEKFNVKKLIFSSSATVYGNSPSPLKEDSEVGKGITNPYGRSKFLIEEILKDLTDWNIVILRYFNPIGCHSSGLIGENPNDIPNNLFPVILKVSSGEYPLLSIFGNDYPTEDGTAVRDFINVEDLANAHIYSISKLNEKGVFIYNVGTGKGTSVKELVDTFCNVNELEMKIEYSSRREGDLAVVYADSEKIKKELNWESNKNLIDSCKSGWDFVKKSKI